MDGVGGNRRVVIVVDLLEGVGMDLVFGMVATGDVDCQSMPLVYH